MHTTLNRAKGWTCPKCSVTLKRAGGHEKYCGREEELFWQKVRKTDTCWMWMGFLNHDGYGRIGPRKNVHTGGRAHRVAWQFTYGPIPLGLEVMHICDVRCCVRPEHLRLGTHKENVRDMWFKERAATKLSRAQVKQIKALIGKMPQKDIARAFQVSDTHISQIATGKQWKDV